MVAGEVKNSSELAKHGASDCKENITEAAADSSATDEIEVPCGRVVQGEARDSEYSFPILLGPMSSFFPCPKNLSRYKEKSCRVIVLHIKMAATHSSRAVEQLSVMT